MVAIISGNSLGLTSSSLDRLGQQGALGQSVHGRSGEGVYVNSTTGNLVVQRTDEVLMGVGPDVNVLRTYNSLGLMNDDNNDNWRIGFYRQIKGLTGTAVNTTGSTITRVEADGAERLYTYDGSKYVNSTGTGATDTLVYNTTNSQWTWTDGDSRITETYDWVAGNGKLLSTKDIDGNTVTYTYTGNLLTKVTTANNTTTQFNTTELIYDTAPGKTNNLLQIKTTAWNGTANQVLTRVRYTYNNNRLETVTVDLSPEDNALLATGSGNVNDGKTYVTTYTYVDSTSKRIASITESNGTSVSFLYDSFGRVKEFTEGGNRTTTLTYLVSSPVVATNLGTAPGPANPVYTVVASDLAAANPWATIANKVYGVPLTDAAAVAQLRAVLGNPILSVGQLLSTPASLSYTQLTNQAPPVVQTALSNVNQNTTVPYNLNTASTALSTTVVQPQTKSRNDGQLANLAPSWSTTTTLGNAALIVLSEKTYLAPNGDGVVVWIQDYDLMVRRYSKASQSWGAAVALDGAAAGSILMQSLSVGFSSNGNIAVAWVQDNKLYARRFVAGTWDALAANGKPAFEIPSPSYPADIAMQSAAINDSGRTVLAYTQNSNLYVYNHNGTSWSNASKNIDDLGAFNSNLVYSISQGTPPLVELDAAGNAMLMWRQVQTNEEMESLAFSRYDATTGSWSTPNFTAVENSSEAIGAYQFKLDANGNGMAVWSNYSGGGIHYIYASRYNRTTNQWSAASYVTASPSFPKLAMSANGNGVLAWQTGSQRIYAWRFNDSGWLTSAPVDIAPAVSAPQRLFSNQAVAINDSGRVVINSHVEQHINGNILNRPYLNVFNGSSWAVIDAQDQSNMVSIDAAGNVQTVWTVKTSYLDYYPTSIHARHYNVGGLGYTVPANPTWESITNALYSTTDAAAVTELRARLGNPPLPAAGTQLTNLPITLNYSTTVTVPAYYTVPAGGTTWAAIASMLYGSANVADELATAMGNVALTAGLKLTVPTRLNDTVTTTVKRYVVPASPTWPAVTQALYGVSVTEAVNALQALLGNPTLVQGLVLNPPATLPYTVSVVANPGRIVTAVSAAPNPLASIYTVKASDVAAANPWAAITQAIYGTSDTAAVNALKAALGTPTLTTGLRFTPPATLSYTSTVAVTATINPSSLSLPSTPSQSVYTVQATDTWSSIAQKLYGVNTLEAQDALKLALGTPTLATGLRLTPPATLTYSGVGAAGSGATVLITDPLNNQTIVKTNAQGRLEELQGPALNGVSQLIKYSYDSNGRVLTSTDARGLITTYAYDPSGNQTLVRDAAGNTITRTYGSLNQLLSETRYTVADPDGAGALLPSGAETTRYVYSTANKLRYVISPEGRVTQYVYGTGATDKGAQISAIQYTSNLYTTAGTPTEANLNTWVTAITDKSKATRVDTAYDFRGQVSSITRFDALTTAGVGVTGAGSSRTDYIYDQAGNLLKTIEAKGVASTAVATDFVTQYFYDGLARVYRFIDSLGVATLTQFDDAGNKTTTTLANGLATTRSYNKLGELIGLAQADGSTALGSTSYVYDKNGRLRQSQDPTGVKTYRLYDAAGRQVAQMESDGTLVESVYNTNNQVVRTIRYAAAVSSANLTALQNDINAGTNTVTLDSLRPAANTSSDRSSWMLYDTANRLAKTIDELGFVTETRYDGASRVVSSTRYNTALSATQRAALTTSTLPNNANATVAVDAANDRTSRNLYGADGQLLGSLDTAGYLTENQYDGAGRLIHTIAYGTQTPSAQWAAGTLAQLRPAANNAQDIHNWVLYNAKNQVVAEVNGEGFLSEHLYDANGNKTQTTRWANKALIDPALITASTLVSALRPAANAAQDQITSWTYSDLNQVRTQTDFQGTVTQYSYDNVGQLIRTDKALGATEQRTLQTRYDKQGRVIGELTAEGSAALVALGASPTAAQVNTVWSQFGLTHAYDQAGRRISTTDQNGNKTRFFYNSDSNLTHSINALGEVTETRYNALNQARESITYGTRLSTATLATLSGGLVNNTLTTAIAGIANAALDSKTVYTYTQRGQLASSTQSVSSSASDTNSITYNAFGERETQTSKIDGANSVTTRYAYTQRGEQKSQTVDAVGGGLNILTQASYDAFGRVTTQLDALGKPTSFTYDRLGRTVETRDRLNIVRRTTYDAFSRVLTQVDGNNQATTYAYNKTDRSITVTTADSISTTITTANRHGETITIRDGRLNTTSYTYDLNGQLKTSTQNQLGISTSNSYDRAGRQILSTDARGTTTKYEFDAANRVLKRTVDEGGLNLITQYAYDPKGQQVTVTDANGGITQTKYDLKGQAVEVIQDAGAGGLNLRTQYSYDARGKTLTVVDANGTTTLYTYDKAGRRTKEVVDPTSVNPSGLNLSRSYVYDANGNVIQAIDGKNQSSFFVYDLNERLVYSVDPLGNTQKNDYDSEGRITKVTRYINPISTAGLDSPAVFSPGTFLTRISDRLTPNVAADVVEHRVYDSNGRLTAMVNGLGEVTRYTLDANGNVLERRSYANRITMSGTGAWVAGTVPTPLNDNSRDQRVRSLFDALNRATHQIDGTGAVVKQVFDANGNVVDRIAYAKPIDPNFVLNAPSTLDAATALIADATKDARTRSSFDKAGRVTWTANGVGAVTVLGYDKNGNVTKTAQYATPIATSAAAGTMPAVSSGQDRVTDMVYDKANRRIYSVDALGQVTQFSYDNNGNLTQQVAHATTVSPVPQPSVGAVAGPALGTYTKADVESRLGAGASTHPDNRRKWMAYDAANRQVFTLDEVDGQGGLGALTENKFDANGNLTQVTRYGSFATNFGSLAAKPTLSQISSLRTINASIDRTEQRQYDAANRLTVQIDGEGYATRNTYDGIGRVSTTTQYELKANADGSTPPHLKDRTNRFFYDQAGRLSSSQDAMGFMEYFAYDGLSNKTSFTNKKNHVWSYSYDAAGRLKQETSPQVALTTMGVDASGKLLEGATTTASVLTQFSYDALGNLSSRIEAAGRPEQRETKYTYDAVGRQIKTEFPPVALYAGVGADSLLVNGVNQLAPRVETTLQTLYTETRYDALGNAVASRDVAGSMSYKTYDALGRVRFDVDALGYVTGHSRNVFGDQTQLTRYAVQTTLVNGSPASLSTSSVQSTVNSLNPAENRTLSSTYDKRGRVITVTEPETYVFDANTGTYSTAGKVTNNFHNAFGQLVRSTSVGAGGQPVVQGIFYDKRGQQIATVDALGYLTTQQFDAVGNLESVVEYNTVVANWATTHGSFNLNPPTVSVHSDDRRVDYTYDANNRKRSEIRKSVVVDQAGATTAGTFATRGARTDLYTFYDYDAVGNLTKTVDAANGATYSYYDALGRTLAVVAPGAILSSTTGGVTTQNMVLPLTEFKRDAFGNVLVQTEHALGALVAANENTAVASLALNASHTDNRKTLTRFDAQGRAIQNADANGVNRYVSYNALGLAAKEWQGVRDVNGLVQTAFRIYDYDKLGRLTGTVEPSANWTVLGSTRVDAALTGNTQSPLFGASTLSISQQTYNAFGEIIFRGGSELNDTIGNIGGRLTSTNPNAGKQEWFRYDKAGRLLATNAEDGQSKYYLYNLQGQRTAEIRSAGVGRSNINLDGYTDMNYDLGDPSKRGIQAIAQLADVRRTNYKLDLLGRTTEEQQPERQSYSATAGTTWAKPIVLRSYDRWGNVKSVTDPRNNQWVTRFEYNANNQVIRQTISDVNTAPGTSSVPQGNLATPLTTGSLNDVVTEVFYDKLGRQIATKDANNKVSVTEYNALGQTVRQINADHSSSINAVTQHRYSTFGDKVATVDANNKLTEYQYNKLGQLTSTIRPEVNVYISQIAPGTEQIDLNVANSGQWKKTTESQTWDEMGRRLSQTDANSNTLKYRYDLRGNLVETIQPMGQSSQSAWDNQGRKLVERNANGDSMSWRVDYFGLALSHTDLGGAIFSYGYDNARQVITQIESGWNWATNRETKQNLRYHYDAAGQVTRITDGGGKFTFYDYDLSGHRTMEVTTRDDKVFQGNINAYDFLGRLRVSESIVDFNVSRSAELDTRIYMMFNPGVSGAPLGYAAAPRGMTQDEYAIWHRGMFGNRPEEPTRITDLPPANTAQTRRDNIWQAWVQLSYDAPGVPSKKAYILAAYLQENRITVAELAQAVYTNEAGIRSYFSQAPNVYGGQGIPIEEYDVDHVFATSSGAVWGPPPPGYGTGATLTAERAATLRAMVQANYLRPRALAMAMLEYQVRPEDIANEFALRNDLLPSNAQLPAEFLASAESNLDRLRRYFRNNNIDPSQYDIRLSAAKYDSQRTAQLQSEFATYFINGDRWGLAHYMLANRVTPYEIAMSPAPNGEIPVSWVHLFMSQAGVPRSAYDITYIGVPSTVTTAADRDAGAGGTGRLSGVAQTILRHMQLGNLNRSNANNPEAAAAIMLWLNISPAEVATALGKNVQDIHAYFAYFGIDKVNYDIAEFKYDERSTPSVLESLRFNREYPVWETGTPKPKTRMEIEYDKVGNRTKIRTGVYDVNPSSLNNAAGTFEEQYFTYDAMNRQIGVNLTQSAYNQMVFNQQNNLTLSQGVTLDADSHLVTYDGVGNRKSDTFLGNRLVASANFKAPITVQSNVDVTERYTYDAQNRLSTTTRDDVKMAASSGGGFGDRIRAVGQGATDSFILESRQYDAAGNLLQSGVDNYPNNTITVDNLKRLYGDNGAGGAKAGPGDDVQRFLYNANNQVRRQSVFRSQGGASHDVYYEGGAGLVHGSAGGSNGYDAAGNVQQYTVRNYQDGNKLSTYRMSYAKRDGYLNTNTQGWNNEGSRNTVQKYDGNGHLREVLSPQLTADNRSFVTDANGTVLGVWQGGVKLQRQLVVNGQVLGRYGEMVNPDNPRGSNQQPNFVAKKEFNFGYTAVGDRYPASSPSSYVVAAGDTLQSIAQSVYGDSGLWYLIADANGLGSSVDAASTSTGTGSSATTSFGLQVGLVLRIPPAVQSANNSSTFKPYDPSSVIGDTGPALPLPPQKKGCGTLGMIIMIVVAVVVTIFTAGAALAAMAPVAAATAAGTATGLAATFAAGTAALTGAVGGLAAVGAAAIGGAVGSIVSQGVGIAIGAQDKFSWKQVALSAFGSGLGASAVGGAVSSGVSSFAGQYVPAAVARGIGAFAGAAVTSAASQGAAVALGVQDKFSWRAVAASAVAAGIGATVGPKTDAFTRYAVRGLAGGAANAVQGKSFGRGFASGAVGAVAEDLTEKVGDAYGTVEKGKGGFAHGMTHFALQGGTQMLQAYINGPTTVYRDGRNDKDYLRNAFLAGGVSGFAGATLGDEINALAGGSERGHMYLAGQMGRVIGTAFGDSAAGMAAAQREAEFNYLGPKTISFNGKDYRVKHPKDPTTIRAMSIARGMLDTSGGLNLMAGSLKENDPLLRDLMANPQSPLYQMARVDPDSLSYAHSLDDVRQSFVSGLNQTSANYGIMADRIMGNLQYGGPTSFRPYDLAAYHAATGFENLSVGDLGQPSALGTVVSLIGIAGGPLMAAVATGGGWVLDRGKATSDQKMGDVLYGLGLIDGNTYQGISTGATQARKDADFAGLLGLGLAGAVKVASLGVTASRARADSGVDLALKFKSGWTEAQRAEAVAKAQILNDAPTVVTASERSGTAAAMRRYRQSEQVSTGRDVDHMVDLQLGGSKLIDNLWSLDTSVNRSLGAQIQHLIKELPLGTRINRVTIGE
jgi:YD repeat-containing protein